MTMNLGTHEELFSVTTAKWLFNDEKQRAIRYIPFNVPALLKIAVQAAGAKGCISFKKINDGVTNRLFSLKFDNDIEIIAKIPYFVAGPRHFCTASEVATLDFIRTELDIPAPKVLAWSSRADSSPTGVEYILYEKIPGVQLNQYDNAGTTDPCDDIQPDIDRIRSQLASKTFSQIGNLYYKEDVPEPLRNRPLYKKDPATPNSTRFCIGPTIDKEFWRAGRSSLDLDRGPWPDTRSYLLALAACARSTVDVHPDPSTHDSLNGLISDYEKLIPHLASICSSCVLWHPDLRPRDIIVTADTSPCRLAGILGWQEAQVAPYEFQYDPPPAGDHEESDDDAETSQIDTPNGDSSAVSLQTSSLDDERKQRRLRSDKAYLHEIYPALAKSVVRMIGFTPRCGLLAAAAAITRSDLEGILIIRHCFKICDMLWGATVGYDENKVPVLPFPFDTSEEYEGERVWKELTLSHRYRWMCEKVLESLNIPSGREGYVGIDKYEEAKRAVEAKKQEILDAAESPEERFRLEQVWPWQDGSKLTYSSSVCY